MGRGDSPDSHVRSLIVVGPQPVGGGKLNTGSVDAGGIGDVVSHHSGGGGKVDSGLGGVSDVASRITHKNPLTAQKGDVVATPMRNSDMFENLGGGVWKHKKSKAMYVRSNTTHTDKLGEWKVSLDKNKIPSPGRKITLAHDGKVLKIDK